MFADLREQSPDKILALMEAYHADRRPEKLDLGVGVYRDAAGNTPIPRAVKTAEERIWQDQTTKTYVALGGDPAFNTAMRRLILGDVLDTERTASVATPGGTGAVRQALELVRMTRPGATVWHSDPTWPNHLTILDHLGLTRRPYRYFDATTGEVDAAGMKADLADAGPDDVILLHGCCHNPTGADLSEADWADVAGIVADSGATAMVDLAYQGFGDGLDADAAGLRHLAGRLDGLIVAASCSKNFGIYRERAGLLMLLTPASKRAAAQSTLAYLNRQNYSFPPDHGARLVQTVLDDPDLRADWESELTDMREGMLGLRRQLAEELRRRTNSDRFDFLSRHRGMFSRLGATPDQVAAMRDDHAVYMVGDSRINVAGLNAETVPTLAAAVAETMS